MTDRGLGAERPSRRPLIARGLGRVAREAGRATVDRRVPRRGPVPLRAEDITPTWLEMTLGAPHRSIAGVRVVDEDSGTAARARIAIDAEPGAGVPATAFVKLMPRSYLQHVLMNLFDLGINEVHAYRALGVDPPVRVPRCHGVAIDPRRRRTILVLEDLGPTARFRTVVDAVTPAEAAAVVDAMADLHAAFWASERFATDLRPLAGRSAVANALGDVIRKQLLGTLRGPAAELVPPEVHEASSLFYEHSGAIDAFWATQPRTLIHADPHLGNLFFVGETPGFLDWQVATANAGIRDVAYFATASVEPDVLRTIERSLVDRYAARLDAAGIEIDPERLWQLYRAGVTELYLAAVSTAGSGERMQPADISRAGVARAVAGVTAHDSFAVLASLAGVPPR